MYTYKIKRFLDIFIPTQWTFYPDSKSPTIKGTWEKLYKVECRYEEVQHGITYITAVTDADFKSEFEPTKYIS